MNKFCNVLHQEKVSDFAKVVWEKTQGVPEVWQDECDIELQVRYDVTENSECHSWE